MFWFLREFKEKLHREEVHQEHLKLLGRAEKLMSPCSCGNTDYSDDSQSEWLVCNVCRSTVGYNDSLWLDNLEQRREFGKGAIDAMFDEIFSRNATDYEPAVNRRNLFKVVK